MVKVQEITIEDFEKINERKQDIREVLRSINKRLARRGLELGFDYYIRYIPAIQIVTYQYRVAQTIREILNRWDHYDNLSGEFTWYVEQP
jgi:predicted metal-dependent phosphoesterase TrpH